MINVFENIHATDSFKNSITTALSSGRFSHAVILEGGNENDSLCAAREIAAYLQCTASKKPCGVCSNCTKNITGSHPDVFVLSGKPGASMIKVDEIRELKRRATVFPNEASKSVFIIVGAERMNPQAQNALLKIFEEPAGHVCFILTCQSKSSLLDTIISRATTYFLGENKNSFNESDNMKAVALASELLEIYVSGNEFDFLKKTAVFIKDKQLFRSTLSAMIPIVRDAMILKSGGKDLFTSDRDLPLRIQNVLTQGKIIKLTEQLQQLNEQAENFANQNLIVTRFCSVMYSIKTNS